ncbi:MAG: hypothetical protein LBL80_02405 [Ruminococcus sp.]|jgi:hypothetical protein|nr:hypothetical protein [Ruminococcus sp.]
MYKKALSVLLSVAISIALILSFPLGVSAEGSKNYYIDGFSAAERAVYSRVLEAVKACKDSVTITAVSSDRADIIGKIGNTLLFYDPTAWNLRDLRYTATGNSVTIEFAYLMEHEDYVAAEAEIESVVDEVVGKIEGKSELTKLRYIHDYIVTNVSYETGGEMSGALYQALINGSAKCDGYALAFQLLCERAGIPCVTVITDPREDVPIGYSVGHAWNKVKISKSWYNIDCTLDDTTLPWDTLCYDYYMLADSEMGSIHKAWDDPFVSEPAAKNTKNSFYEVKKLTAGTAVIAEELIERQLSEGNIYAAVEIPDKDILDETILNIKASETKNAFINPERQILHIKSGN